MHAESVLSKLAGFSMLAVTRNLLNSGTRLEYPVNANAIANANVSSAGNFTNEAMFAS